jgi:hypothetical protein
LVQVCHARLGAAAEEGIAGANAVASGVGGSAAEGTTALDFRDHTCARVTGKERSDKAALTLVKRARGLRQDDIEADLKRGAMTEAEYDDLNNKEIAAIRSAWGKF